MSPADRRRLVGMLGRLGSDQQGERDAAACMVTGLLQKMQTTWEHVVASVGPPPIIAANEDHRTLAARLLQRAAMLDPAETAFLRSIIAWRKISAKQATWLSDIAVKVAGAEMGA